MRAQRKLRPVYIFVKRDVVPQGYLFRCAPLQDAASYAEGASVADRVGRGPRAPPGATCILRRDIWVPPYEYMGRTESSAPTKQNKNHAKRDVEDGVPYEEVYGDTAVRCGRNQLGGGA